MGSKIEELQKENIVSRLNGIMDCIYDRSADSEEINALFKLVDDDRVIGGRKISSYASAALFLLGKRPKVIDEDAKLLIADMS